MEQLSKDANQQFKEQKYDLSSISFQQLLDLRKSKLGENDLLTLVTMNNLASSYIKQKNYIEAENILIELLSKRKTILGLQHIDTLQTTLDLGSLFTLQNKYDSAEPLLSEYVKSIKNIHPTKSTTTTTATTNDDMKVIVALTNLGTIYYKKNDWIHAIEVFKEIITKRQQQQLTVSSSSSPTATTGTTTTTPSSSSSSNEIALSQAILTLTDIYIKTNQYQEAEQLSLNDIMMKKNMYHPHHKKVIAAMMNLAKLYQKMKKYYEAIQTYQDILELKRSKPSSSSSSSSSSMKNNTSSTTTSSSKNNNKDDGGDNDDDGDDDDWISLLMNIGQVYFIQNDFVNASMFLQQYIDRMTSSTSTINTTNSTSVKSIKSVGITSSLMTSSKALLPKYDVMKDQDLILSIINCGTCYYHLKQFDQALLLFEDILFLYKDNNKNMITQKVLPVESLAVINTIACNYSELNTNALVTEQLFLACYKGRCKQLGESHPHTINTLKNLANYYKRIENYTQAEVYFILLSDELKRSKGVDKLETIQALSNLAYIWKHLKKYEYAEPLYNDILIYYTSHTGPDSEETIKAMIDIAMVCYYQEKYHITKPLLQYCYELKLAKYGDQHTEVISLLLNLANILYSQRNYPEAEKYYQNLLTIHHKKVPEEASLEKINCMICLSSIYTILEKYQQAETMYLELIELKKELFGIDHIEVTFSVLSLITIYFKLKKYNDAEILLLSCLSAQKVYYEDNYHIDCLSTMNNLASCYYLKQEYKKAEDMYLICLEKRRKLVGDMHVDTLICLNNLGSLYFNVMKWKEAYTMFEECLNGRTVTLGIEHPDTILSHQHFEIAKTRWSPTQIIKPSTEPIQLIPIVEENIQPTVYIDNQTNVIKKEDFEKAISKVSGGLAEKMKMLDFSKILLPGGPPPKFLKKEPVAASDTSGNLNNGEKEHEVISSSNHPYANNERYKVIIKMKTMRIPEGAIRQKMMKENFTPKEIDDFFTMAPITNEDKKASGGINEKFSSDPKFAGIIKLRNLKVPEIAIRHKMKSEGFSQVEIDEFFTPVI